MITAVKNVSVYVTDVDRAIAFYTEALGFEKRSDARMGPIRWVELAPGKGGTVIALASEGYPTTPRAPTRACVRRACASSRNPRARPGAPRRSSPTRTATRS